MTGDAAIRDESSPLLFAAIAPGIANGDQVADATVQLRLGLRFLEQNELGNGRLAAVTEDAAPARRQPSHVR